MKSYDWRYRYQKQREKAILETLSMFERQKIPQVKVKVLTETLPMCASSVYANVKRMREKGMIDTVYTSQLEIKTKLPKPAAI